MKHAAATLGAAPLFRKAESCDSCTGGQTPLLLSTMHQISQASAESC